VFAVRQKCPVSAPVQNSKPAFWNDIPAMFGFCITVITIQLNGRLGNQMFQYAAAMALADRWRTEVKFDLSLLATSGNRYELSCFGIAPIAATTKDLPLRQREASFTLLKRGKSLLERLFPPVRKTVLLERTPFSFQEDFLEHSSSCYLSGYFQNELYFKGIEDKIRHLFTLKVQISEPTRTLMLKLKHFGGISVHVRRGDYVHNRQYNEFFGVCATEFYVNACEAARSLIKAPLWVFLSDDTSWVRSSLLPILLQKKLIVNYAVVDWTGSELAFEDLCLMSSAQHHIISNSTFSWWGAWLNSHAKKKVFAPRRWLQAADAAAILPPEWTRIAN
jgi:hypothetical protein